MIATLQKSTRLGDFETFKEFCRAADRKEEPIFIRNFLLFNSDRPAVALEEVEP